MTRKKYKKVIAIVQILFLSTIFISCNKGQGEKEINESTIDEVNRQHIILKQGAFVNEENNEFETYDFTTGDEFEKIDTQDKVITAFNNESKAYTFYKDNRYYINYDLEDILIDHDNVSNLKISPSGNYLFYFVKDEFLIPVVMDLNEKKEIYIENKAVISGQYIDWITDTQLAFYGVDTEEKDSGLFVYDVKSNKEEKLYGVSNGYVKYLKHISNGIALVEERYGEESILNIINIDGTVERISDEIVDIGDIVVQDEDIYVLGRAKNNNYSIYKISDGTMKRLVFDFPEKIYIEKGFTMNEEGELLFIGGSSAGKNELLYKYSDGSVSLICDNMKNINFIKVN